MMIWLSNWRRFIGYTVLNLTACLWMSQTALAQNRTVAEACVNSLAEKNTGRKLRIIDGSEPGFYLAVITISGRDGKEHRKDAAEIEKTMAQCHMNARKLIAHEIFSTCDQSGNSDDCFSRKRYVVEVSDLSPTLPRNTSSNQHSAILDWIRYRTVNSGSTESDLAIIANADSKSPHDVQVEISGFSHTACHLVGLAFDGSATGGYIFNGKNVIEIRQISQVTENIALINMKSRSIAPPKICEFVMKFSMHIYE